MRCSISVNVRLLTRQKSAEYSSSLRPQVPLRSLPGNGSSVTRLMYFSRLTQSRKRSKHARKMARSTQLHGCVASLRPIRNPKPRQMLHAGAASANVSDRVHSISSSSLLHPNLGITTESFYLGDFSSLT